MYNYNKSCLKMQLNSHNHVNTHAIQATHEILAITIHVYIRLHSQGSEGLSVSSLTFSILCVGLVLKWAGMLTPRLTEDIGSQGLHWHMH